MQHRPERCAGRRWGRRVALVAGLVVLSGWMVFFRPQSLGGTASYLTVSGNSMESRLSTGDLVVVRRQPAYKVGDVVAYRVPKGEPGAGAMVIHRITGGNSATGYVLQGDNRASADLWRPRTGDIVGRMWFSLVGGGRAVSVVQRPVTLAAIAAGLAMWATLGLVPKQQSVRCVGREDAQPV